MKNNQTNKGFKMALPFIAGVALGALAVVAYNKKDKLIDIAKDSLEKGKELAKDGVNEGKKLIKNGKKTINKLTADQNVKTMQKQEVKKERKPRRIGTKTAKNLSLGKQDG